MSSSATEDIEMSGNSTAPASTANAPRPDWLFAGIALRTPNSSPGAIPIPDSIAFLYSLQRRRLSELDPRDSDCPICLKKFRTDGPSGDVDIFRERREVPLVLPCSHIIGSRCAYKLYSPFKHSENFCSMCRKEFFPIQNHHATPAGMDRAIRLFDWIIQECSRRLAEGPEEGKEEARNKIEYTLAVRANCEVAREEMRTGHVVDWLAQARSHIQQGLAVARQIRRLDGEVQRLDRHQDELHLRLAELQVQEDVEWARLTGIAETLRDHRARLRANIERIREQIRGQWARNMMLIASLREQRTQISNEILRTGEAEVSTLREMATTLEGERLNEEVEGPSAGAQRLNEDEEAERPNEEAR